MEKGKTIAELEVGQIYEKTTDMTEEKIRLFAEATGDRNPVHLDEEFAKKTIFRARVAQGALTAGFISGVLGCEFPGSGTIYLSQTARFMKPVFIGDQITVRLKVLELIPEKNRVRLETICLNQKGKEVLAGEALVMPPR
jgi:3-hydroxybutyryl-CoA dehydratase